MKRFRKNTRYSNNGFTGVEIDDWRVKEKDRHARHLEYKKKNKYKDDWEDFEDDYS